ncbi:MAG: histidinol-phosphate transaminase [Alphaproteobacteria bacterium]
MTDRPACPRPVAGIDAIAPYLAGSSHGAGDGRTVKLSSNEGALGPSPAAIEAARKAAGDLTRYPDPHCEGLREAIGAAHGLDPARIVCGNGSDEILALLAQCYLAPGDEAIMAAHTFAVYDIAAKANGAVIRTVPDPNLRTRVEDLLAAVTSRTRILFLANPNNPTGTYLTADEIRALHSGLPETVLLVLDGAYAEYVRGEDYSAGAALVEAYDNIVMTRTFSKMHALAALRLGWAYASEPIAAVLNKVRAPFNVNAVAQAAGIAALADTAHQAAVLAHNETWRPWLTQHLEGQGLSVVPSAANFVLARFPSAEAAQACNAALRARNILVRPTGSFGLPDALRITVGPEEDLGSLMDALGALLGPSADRLAV